jgi:hypothetical protein
MATWLSVFILFLTGIAHAATLSGTVSGLLAGRSVVISSGSNLAIVKTDGVFQITDGGPLVIKIQPSGQLCTVESTTVSCFVAYNVSGTITGLTASGLVLRLNSSTQIIPVNATSFKFATTFISGAPYSVKIGIAPAGLYCLVTNGTGIINSANVTNVAVTCDPFVSTTVTWTQPTMNTDGSVLTDLSGYILFYGTDPTLKTCSSRLIGSPTILTTTISNLMPRQTYYFAIASRSTSGGTGPRSNTASASL